MDNLVQQYRQTLRVQAPPQMQQLNGQQLGQQKKPQFAAANKKQNMQVAEKKRGPPQGYKAQVKKPAQPAPNKDPINPYKLFHKPRLEELRLKSPSRPNGDLISDVQSEWELMEPSWKEIYSFLAQKMTEDKDRLARQQLPLPNYYSKLQFETFCQKFAREVDQIRMRSQEGDQVLQLQQDDMKSSQDEPRVTASAIMHEPDNHIDSDPAEYF